MRFGSIPLNVMGRNIQRYFEVSPEKAREISEKIQPSGNSHSEKYFNKYDIQKYLGDVN